MNGKENRGIQPSSSLSAALRRLTFEFIGFLWTEEAIQSESHSTGTSLSGLGQANEAIEPGNHFYHRYQNKNLSTKLVSATICSTEASSAFTGLSTSARDIFLARHISILWVIGFCLPARKWHARDKAGEQSKSDKFHAIPFEWKSSGWRSGREMCTVCLGDSKERS